MVWWQSIKQKLDPVSRWLTIFKRNAAAKTRRKPAPKPIAPGRTDTVKQPEATGFHAEASATKWGLFIDGFNRLPRPLLTVAILGFFLVAPLYPDAFLKVATAYAKMPHGFWALLSVVVGFYFSGRMQSKSHALRIHETLEAVLEKTGDDKVDDPAAPLMEADYQAALAKGARKKPNNMIDRWKRNRRKG